MRIMIRRVVESILSSYSDKRDRNTLFVFDQDSFLLRALGATEYTLLVPAGVGRLNAIKPHTPAAISALRHQLIVLRRKMQGRVRLTNSDRWFFIQLYRWFPSILKVLTAYRIVNIGPNHVMILPHDARTAHNGLVGGSSPPWGIQSNSLRNATFFRPPRKSR